MTREIEQGYPGQYFDDYLKEQGTYEATTEQAFVPIKGETDSYIK